MDGIFFDGDCGRVPGRTIHQIAIVHQTGGHEKVELPERKPGWREEKSDKNFYGNICKEIPGLL
jgi:hypothetical protein